MNKKTIAIILAAGSSNRMHITNNKVLYLLGQKTVLEYVLESFEMKEIDEIIISYNKKDEERISNIIKGHKKVRMTLGGDTRFASVKNALQEAQNLTPEIVIIHDGARINITQKTILQCIENTKIYGSAICATRPSDTLYKINEKNTYSPLNRNEYITIQTPQAFMFEDIIKAYTNSNEEATDDSQIFLKNGKAPHFVFCQDENIKITTYNDLYKINRTDISIGCGFDIHKLTPNRKLIIGGTQIPYELGLLGHSDADVLLHAVMDALLSAASKKDIGHYFPQNEKYKNANSKNLLARVMEIISPHKVSYVSANIIAQVPKLSPYLEEMKSNIASELFIDKRQVGLCATTAEEIGIIGKKEAIAASCVCLLYN